MYRKIFAGLALAAIFATPVLAANDPLVGHQWGFGRIQAEAAWGPGNSGAGVIVAVVDTGANFGVEDLAGQSAGAINVISGQSGNPCRQGTGDNNGHGTMVSGVIAARSNNGAGIASVAPAARILSVKALGCKGGGSLGDVSDGVRQAADLGARVINLSLGPDFISHLLIGLLGDADKEYFRAAVRHAAGRGALVVAASGNDLLNSYYAGEPNIVVAGASGLEDRRAGYSSPGEDLLAPGGDGDCDAGRCIVTTGKDGDYPAVQGTSFAAPQVSGIAALLYSKGFTAPADVRNVIIASADGVPDGRRANAARALGATPPAGGGGGGTVAGGSNPAQGPAPGVGSASTPGSNPPTPPSTTGKAAASTSTPGPPKPAAVSNGPAAVSSGPPAASGPAPSLELAAPGGSGGPGAEGVATSAAGSLQAGASSKKKADPVVRIALGGLIAAGLAGAGYFYYQRGLEE